MYSVYIVDTIYIYIAGQYCNMTADDPQNIRIRLGYPSIHHNAKRLFISAIVRWEFYKEKRKTKLTKN